MLMLCRLTAALLVFGTLAGAAPASAQSTPRAVLFVFVNQDGMAQAEHVVGGRNTDVRDPRAGYAWANTIWIDNDQHPAAADRAQAVAHEFSHLFTAVVTHGNKVPTWFNEG